MTNTTFERFNAYWPYDREMDALQYRDSPGGLLSFPESTGSSQSVKVAHGLDNSASGLRKHGDGSDLDDEDVNRFRETSDENKRLCLRLSDHLNSVRNRYHHGRLQEEEQRISKNMDSKAQGQGH